MSSLTSQTILGGPASPVPHPEKTGRLIKAIRARALIASRGKNKVSMVTGLVIMRQILTQKKEVFQTFPVPFPVYAALSAEITRA